MILVTTVVDLRVESHNWQFLSGDHKLLSSASIAALDLTHLLQRVSKKCADRFLKLSVYLSHTKIRQEEVVVDTNIREKNTFLPQILAKKVIDTCRKIANKEKIHQRENSFVLLHTCLVMHLIGNLPGKIKRS